MNERPDAHETPDDLEQPDGLDQTDELDDAPASRVIVVRGARADRETALEIARILESAVTLAPLGDGGNGVAVVPHGATASIVVWPQRLRPVHDLVRLTDGSVHAAVFTTKGPRRGGGVRDQLLAHTLPTETWSSDGPTTPADLASELELPILAAELLHEQRRIDDLPGALSVDRVGALTTIKESLLARPEGTSIVDRMRRLDHDAPHWSVVIIVVAALLAVAAFWFPFAPGHPLAAGSLRGLWLAGATLLALDAIGSAIVLVAVRRRRRGGRPA